MSLLMENSYAKIGCGDPGDPIEHSALIEGGNYVKFSPVGISTKKALINSWPKVWDCGQGFNTFLYSSPDFAVGSYFYFGLSGDGKIRVIESNGTIRFDVSTVASFRNGAAFNNPHLVINTTQLIEADRIKLWIDDLPVALAGSFPSLNYDMTRLGGSVEQYLSSWIGSSGTPAGGVGLYLARCAYGDDPDAYVPSDFGYRNDDGAWVPKTIVDTSGLLYLAPFSDQLNMGLNLAGADLTVVGSVEQTADAPILSNRAILDVNGSYLSTVTNGGLVATASGGGGATMTNGTFPIPKAGEYRYAVNVGADATSCCIGARRGAAMSRSGAGGALGIGNWQPGEIGYNGASGTINVDGVTVQSGLTVAIANDDLGAVYNADVEEFQFYLNGSPIGSPVTYPWSRDLLPAFSKTVSYGSYTVDFDPAGFASNALGLVSANLPCPAILNPETYVARRECIGGAGVSDLQFSPLAHDVVIISGRRDLETDWRLNYSIAGVLQDPICTNDPAAGPIVGEDGLTLTANGFDVGAATPYQGTCWHRIFRVGGLGGLSVTRVNHTGGTTTAPHGSGGPIAYGLIIPRAGGDIRVLHHKADAGDYWLLNSNAGFENDPGWFVSSANDLTLGGALPVGEYDVIGWSEVDQFSSFSKIKGNGLVNGPQDICDYVPLLMFGRKQGAGESNWIMDRKFNPVTTMQYLSGTTILYSSTGYAIDFNTNGLKWRTDSSSWNPSGGYVFTSSWAVFPIKFATAQ